MFELGFDEGIQYISFKLFSLTLERIPIVHVPNMFIEMCVVPEFCQLKYYKAVR